MYGTGAWTGHDYYLILVIDAVLSGADRPMQWHPATARVNIWATVSAHILSASRRTDIPAFFTPWLMQRIRAGVVMVRNPRNPAHVMRVSLLAHDVIAVVFWSRNYGPLIEHLDEIDDRGLRPIFQFTFTGYGPPLELRSPSFGIESHLQSRGTWNALCR